MTAPAQLEDTVTLLQRLTQVNIDSRESLVEAAEQVEAGALANSLRAVAAQRNDQAVELGSHLAQHGVEPATTPTFVNVLQQTWLDIRAAFGGGTATILSELERAEDSVRNAYEDALRHPNLGGLSEVIYRHHAAVKASHDGIRAMRDGWTG